MNKEEITEKLKILIEDYEVCYKESDYEGNFEEYKNLKETHELLKNALNYISKLKEENEELNEKYKNINWYFENQKDNFVSKDKIRNKMKEIEFYINNVDNNEGKAIYKVLEDLLKEN